MESDVLGPKANERVPALLWLALACLLGHLPLIFMSSGSNYDMQSYAKVAETIFNSGPLYGNPELLQRYPYFPTWALLLGFLKLCADLSHLPLLLLFKLPAFLGDLAVGFLIYFIVERLMLPVALTPSSRQDAFWLSKPFAAALAWMLNPVAIMISAGHGQFDSLAIAFILLAAWFSEFSENPHADLWSAANLALAISLKSWPLYFLPLFLGLLPSASERHRYLALALGLPLLLLLPFIAFDGLSAVLHSLEYAGAPALSLPEAVRGLFFISGASSESFAQVAGFWRSVAILGLLLFWLWMFLFARRLPLFAGLAWACLSLYVLAPGFSPQYLCWLLPLALLLPGNLAKRYTGVAVLILSIFYLCLMPEALYPEGLRFAAPFSKAQILFWSFLNLSLWFYFLWEWLNLRSLCRRYQGRLGLR